MSKFFLFTIDLISKEKFLSSDIQVLKEKIMSLGENVDLPGIISDVAQLTKDGRVEIYAEDTGININSGEEVLSFIKMLEKEIGGFVSGSYFEVGKENPSPTEKWVKSDYSWEAEEVPEEENSWDEGAYWNDEWEEWNEEWN